MEKNLELKLGFQTEEKSKQKSYQELDDAFISRVLVFGGDQDFALTKNGKKIDKMLPGKDGRSLP